MQTHMFSGFKILFLGLFVVFLYCPVSIVYADSPETILKDATVAREAGDYHKARRLYHVAAKQGNVVAMNALGVMAYRGLGAPKNEKQAFFMIREAADLGYPKAQYHIGIFYEAGVWVKKDISKAYRWMDLAAKSGDPDAQKWLSERGENPELAATEQNSVHASVSEESKVVKTPEVNLPSGSNAGTFIPWKQQEKCPTVTEILAQIVVGLVIKGITPEPKTTVSEHERSLPNGGTTTVSEYSRTIKGPDRTYGPSGDWMTDC